MIWLGLNYSFGYTDCVFLKCTDVGFVNVRVILSRIKTGIYRDMPLRPEAIRSLQKNSRKGSLIFYTSIGKPYVQIK